MRPIPFQPPPIPLQIEDDDEDTARTSTTKLPTARPKRRNSVDLIRKNIISQVLQIDEVPHQYPNFMSRPIQHSQGTCCHHHQCKISHSSPIGVRYGGNYQPMFMPYWYLPFPNWNQQWRHFEIPH
jgi:hypothetical protein